MITKQEALDCLNTLWNESCKKQYDDLVCGFEDEYHYEQGYMDGLKKAIGIMQETQE